ncbi:hypothetical protein RFI_21928, partial [Reticulomyxa filosa]
DQKNVRKKKGGLSKYTCALSHLSDGSVWSKFVESCRRATIVKIELAGDVEHWQSVNIELAAFYSSIVAKVVLVQQELAQLCIHCIVPVLVVFVRIGFESSVLNFEAVGTLDVLKNNVQSLDERNEENNNKNTPNNEKKENSTINHGSLQICEWRMSICERPINHYSSQSVSLITRATRSNKIRIWRCSLYVGTGTLVKSTSHEENEDEDKKKQVRIALNLFFFKKITSLLILLNLAIETFFIPGNAQSRHLRTWITSHIAYQMKILYKVAISRSGTSENWKERFPSTQVHRIIVGEAKH